MVHQVGCVFTACGKCQLITQHIDMALLQLVHQVGYGSPGGLCLRSVWEVSVDRPACRHGFVQAGSPGELIVFVVCQHVDTALLQLVHQVSCVCVRSVTQHVDMALLQLVHQVG